MTCLLLFQVGLYGAFLTLSVSFDGEFFEASTVRFEYQFPPPATPVNPEPQPLPPGPAPDPWGKLSV
jgi:hypothetical protein